MFFNSTFVYTEIMVLSRSFRKILNSIFFLLILVGCLIICSCKSNAKGLKINLGDSFYYLEVGRDATFEDVCSKSDSFKKLEKKDMNRLAKLLTSRKNDIWLKTSFKLPPYYDGTDLGLFAAYIHTASQVYLNGVLVGSYGYFSPKEFTPGFVAHYYVLHKEDLFSFTNNELYIKIWPGGFCSISQNIYISEPAIAELNESFVTFLNSKINFLFSGSMMLVFILYILMYFGMKTLRMHKEYLSYALLNFYTVHFLLIFYTSDIPGINSGVMSYLSFLKIFFFCGGFVTVYFANNFIRDYINLEQKLSIKIVRLVLLIIPCLLTIASPNYKILSITLIFSGILSLSQFAFTVPGLIKKIIDKETRALSLKLLKGFTPIFACIAIDCVVRFIFDYKALPYFTIYGWQLTIVVFLCFLVKDFTSAFVNNVALGQKLTSFNSQLEIEVKERTKQLSEKNEILTEGLRAVSNVQKNFLPPKKAGFKGWDLAISYKPLVDEVSGDLYDYYFSGSNLDGVGIFDVSGHGIPSGLMTILAKGIISQHFLNGITQSEPISEVLEKINKTYIKEKVNVDNYITGLLLRFSDFNAQNICSVEIANAGHPHPYLYNAETKEITELMYKGPKKQYGMIGIDQLPVSFPPISFRMCVNDIIVCFTDGLTDALNTEREEFGKQRIIDLIKKYSHESAAEILSKITVEVEKFTKNMAPNDDITIIVLKRTNPKDFVEELEPEEFLEIL